MAAERRWLQVWHADGLRIDLFLGQCLDLSRSQLQKRVSSLAANRRAVKMSYKLRRGDVLDFCLAEEVMLELQPEPLPLDICYQDDDLFVLNKAQGLVVHPGDGHHSGTLIQGLLHYDRQQRRIDADPLRMGLVHRLDKDTSGLLLVARNSRSLDYFSQQFAARQVEKFYLALVRGQLPASGSINAPLGRDPHHRQRFKVVSSGGKAALTNYRVLARRGLYALVKLQPLSGRTHQLRCHLCHLQAPIVGDPIYSRPDPSLRQATLMLHALALRIRLPGSGRQRLFYAPLPPHFKETLRQCWHSA